MRLTMIGPALLLGCLMPAHAGATDSINTGERSVAVLTREQAVEYALENNPELRATGQGVRAARARRLQADGFEPPTVAWEFEEANSGRPSNFGNQIYGVEQSIEWPGVRQARKQAADSGVAAADAALERARLRVTAQTQKAFDGALLADRTVELVRQVAGFMGEAVELSRVRFKSGMGSYVDPLRTRIAHRRLQTELRDVEVAASKAQRRLAVLLGLEGAGLSLQGELDVPSLALNRRTWLAGIEQSGPTFILIKRRVEQADKAYTAIRRGRLPELTIGVGRQRLFNGADSDYGWAGQLGLKFPLPGSDMQRGREREALAARGAVQDRGRALRLEALARLNQRFDEAEALAAQVKGYRADILPDVEDQRKAAQNDYRVRRIDALNLLDVYSTYLGTRRTYLETLTRYRAAVADLNALGEDLWEIE